MSSSMSYQSTAFLVALILAITGVLGPASAQAVADPFAPLSVTLQPVVVQGSLPSWASGNISLHPESDSVEIPVPALASQDAIGCFALTVVFRDNGDGGPVVEWQPPQGNRILLSAGLGENGIALGFNSRTLLLPQSLALDGGTLFVSFASRFSRLLSVTLRPARELGVAALGDDFTPALLGRNEWVLTEEEVSGAEIKPQSGDQTEGQVVHADLTSAPKQLAASGSGGSLEFIIPLGAKPQGSMLQAEVGGLDPESWIEVSVNGESFGALGAAPFPLNAPSVLFSESGRLLNAGWRPSSLFLPARLWKEGENSLLLTLRRVSGDEGNPLYLRKARIDLLFAPSGGTSDLLSTGSRYGNPSPSLFHSTVPLSLQ